jgi:uncharacterized membrane protein
MGNFLLILLAIAVVLVLAYLLSRLNDLQSAFANFTQDVNSKIRRLEDQISAQASAHAEETARLAKQTAENPGVGSPVATPAPVSAMQTYAAQATPSLETTIQARDPQPPPLPARTVPPVQAVQVAEPIQPATSQRPVNPIPTSAPQNPPRWPPFAEKAQSISLEERLGANWLNKLGIVILVIGMAFFLAVRLKTMGPGGKVLTGLTISLGLLGGGIWL